MSASAGTAGAPTPASRELIEAKVTRDRILELELDPVRGAFDAAHLREVNRRIFQDMPGKGFSDVTPGVYRNEVPAGQDWLKNRAFTTVPGTFLVAYSPMDAASRERIESVLLDAKPDRLAVLEPTDFARRIAKVYAEIDYLHPFPDGNSRTLRTFTKQLAKAAGFELDWERFGQTPDGRDKLYIARDLSVNEIAFPKMTSHRAMVGVAHAMHSLAANPNLEKLLQSAIRPLPGNAIDPLAGVHEPSAQRHQQLAQELERAMTEKGVPESLRPELRKIFAEELKVRVARGDFGAPSAVPAPAKRSPGNPSDPPSIDVPKLKR